MGILYLLSLYENKEVIFAHQRLVDGVAYFGNIGDTGNCGFACRRSHKSTHGTRANTFDFSRALGACQTSRCAHQGGDRGTHLAFSAMRST